MKYKIIILLLLSGIIGCCDFDSDIQIDESKIYTILDDINCDDARSLFPESGLKCVIDMNSGEIRYIVEWAVNENGELNPCVSVHNKRGGTVNIKIICISKGKYKLSRECFWNLIRGNI